MATMSFLSRILNGGGDGKGSGKPTAMITKDLLGGGRLNSLVDSSKELDLDLDLDVHVPSGWEKHLDLKSGKLYINRCNSMNSSSSSSKTQDDNNNKVNYTTTTTPSKLQLLNSNMSSKQETNIDLNLLLSPTPPALSPVASSSTFHSVVCTLDKVKSALERADRAEASRNVGMKRQMSVSMMSTSSHSSSSVKVSDHRLMEEEEEEEKSSSSSASASASAMYAASCRNCLLYVLVYKNNPKCPRCQVTVPSPTALKKPLIDLNISL